MGSRGGGWCPRAAAGALFIALAAARLVSQSAPGSSRALDDLTSELAARIAAIISPRTEVALDSSIDDAILRSGLVDRLRERGVRVIDIADGVPVVRAGCLENLRERVCAAEIGGEAGQAVLVTRPRDSASVPAAVSIGLELRPLRSQRGQILDIATVDESFLILGPTDIVRYEQADGSWRAIDSHPIAPGRSWPRDVRGRLRATDDDVEAFLPGVTCRGSIEPLKMTCANSSETWPLPIENASLEPSRNYFKTPDGLTFYSVAPLDVTADARWLMVGVDGVLTFLDESRRAVGTAFAAGDVATIRPRCAGTYVLVASSPRDRDGDLLTLFQVTRRRLTPAAPPIQLPGRLTALWSSARAETATVITHDGDAARYDVQQLTASCQ